MLANPLPGAFANDRLILEEPPALSNVADEAIQAFLVRRGHDTRESLAPARRCNRSDGCYSPVP